jgi:hypothetical protein
MILDRGSHPKPTEVCVYFRIVARHRIYGILAAALCAAVVVSAGAAAPQPRIYSLKIGDRFDVKGTQIRCAIGGAPSASRVPVVTCRLVRSGSNVPVPRSYAVSIADRGVTVLGPGSTRDVIFDIPTDAGVPLGDPAPRDRSPGARVAQLRPVAQGLEAVNVARTSVVCVAVAYPRPHPPSLNCTLSSRAIAKALLKPRLGFRPFTVDFSPQLLRISRMSKTKTQRVVFSRRQPTG